MWKKLRDSDLEELVWQAIGMSSDPNDNDNSVSLDMALYLNQGSRMARKHNPDGIHLVLVADNQHYNYMVRHNLPESQARRIALRKGKEKATLYKKVGRAMGLKNLRVITLSEFRKKNQEIFDQVERLYDNSAEFREDVLKCVPQRILSRAFETNLTMTDQEIERNLSMYALEEIAFILALGGTKLGHSREVVYDDLALKVFQKYGIGRKPGFHYSENGLEQIPGTKMLVEPYSTKGMKQRLVITDGREDVSRKLGLLDDVSEKRRDKYLRKLGRITGVNPDEPSFYDKVFYHVHGYFADREYGKKCLLGFVLAIGFCINIYNDQIENGKFSPRMNSYHSEYNQRVKEATTHFTTLEAEMRIEAINSPGRLSSPDSYIRFQYPRDTLEIYRTVKAQRVEAISAIVRREPITIDFPEFGGAL